MTRRAAGPNQPGPNQPGTNPSRPSPLPGTKLWIPEPPSPRAAFHRHLLVAARLADLLVRRTKLSTLEPPPAAIFSWLHAFLTCSSAAPSSRPSSRPPPPTSRGCTLRWLSLQRRQVLEPRASLRRQLLLLRQLLGPTLDSTQPTWTQLSLQTSSSPRPGVVLIRMRFNSSHRLDLSFAGPVPGRH
jgi:hypothetical protein